MSSQQETDKWRRVDFLERKKTLKGASNYPHSSVFRIDVFGETAVRFLFNTLSNALLHSTHIRWTARQQQEATHSAPHMHREGGAGSTLTKLCCHFFFFVCVCMCESEIAFPHLNLSASSFDFLKAYKDFPLVPVEGRDVSAYCNIHREFSERADVANVRVGVEGSAESEQRASREVEGGKDREKEASMSRSVQKIL